MDKNEEASDTSAERSSPVRGSDAGSDGFFNSLCSYYPGIDLDTFRLARGLGRSHILMMALADDDLRPAGLSWSKLFVLMWLRVAHDRGRDGLGPSDLSKVIAVTRTTISALLGGLEQQGFIERELDPHDKRRFVIRLTAAGAAVVQEAARPVFEDIQQIVEQMDPERRAALLEGLDLFQELLLRRQDTPTQQEP